MVIGRDSQRAIVLLMLVVACCATVASAADPAPAGRNKPVFAFDPTLKSMVVFGGYSGGNPAIFADAWSLAGGGWRPLPNASFPARASAGVATDTRRGRVVLFGGNDEAGVCGDTLEWDGTVWKRVAWSGPTARAAPQLAYDNKRGRVVLFGGLDADQKTLADTWEWDGQRWTKLADSGPPPRYHHVMVYDSAHSRIVLFGGNAGGASYATAQLGDTWEWDGAKWTRASDTGPSRRDHHAMAYDEARSQVVLFGGWDGKALGDLWVWDGAWRRVDASGPSARGGMPSMTYDPLGKSVLLYGGANDGGLLTDVWRWDGRAWTRVD